MPREAVGGLMSMMNLYGIWSVECTSTSYCTVPYYCSAALYVWCMVLLFMFCVLPISFGFSSPCFVLDPNAAPVTKTRKPTSVGVSSEISLRCWNHASLKHENKDAG